MKKKDLTTLPNSKESEMMVLGCMLNNTKSLDIGLCELNSQDFYYKENKIVFECLKDLYRSNGLADARLAAEELKRIGKLEDVGGMGYLTSITKCAETSAHSEEYIKLVKKDSVLRHLIFICRATEKQAFSRSKDAKSVLEDAQQKLFEISQSNLKFLGKKAQEFLEREDDLYPKAYQVIMETGTVSTTFLQRKLKIGYACAAYLMDELEAKGIIGSQDGSRQRVLLKKNQIVE